MADPITAAAAMREALIEVARPATGREGEGI